SSLRVSLYTLYDQLSFPIPPQSLNGNLPLHRGLPIRLFLHVYQLYWQTHTRIFCAASLVVRIHTFLRIQRPAGVICPVCAFNNIAITSHNNPTIKRSNYEMMKRYDHPTISVSVFVPLC